MLQSLYSAKMGIIAQQTKVDVIANNIANINTYGFKGSNVSFKDTLYTAMRRPVESEAELNLRQGNGVMVAGIKRFFSEGAPIVTGVPLDFRIEGDGFFTVEGDNGEQLYTRSGTFAVSTEGTERYLVDSRGSYVLDTGLNRIELPADINEFTVNSAGEIYIDEVYSTTLKHSLVPKQRGPRSCKKRMLCADRGFRGTGGGGGCQRISRLS